MVKRISETKNGGGYISGIIRFPKDFVGKLVSIRLLEGKELFSEEEKILIYNKKKNEINKQIKEIIQLNKINKKEIEQMNKLKEHIKDLDKRRKIRKKYGIN